MLDGRRVWLVLAVLSACGRGGLTNVSSDLTIAPSPVVFHGWAGLTQTITVEVRNRGTVAEQAEVTVTGPFTADASSIEVEGGGVTRLVISYHPREPGHHSGVLIAGAARAELQGDAKAPPDCVSSVCGTSTFDPGAGSCVLADRPNGTACETVCVKGFCQAGECRGAFNGCDDGDGCTVDSCDETSGCAHTARQCNEPRNPCEAAFCDSQTGCGVSEVRDGTPCAADACDSAVAHVCLSGRCEERVRTVSACTDGWSHPFMLWQDFAVTTYDSDRQRVVMFSTREGGTWEWDGARWLERSPAHSPETALGGVLTYDSVRKVSVFFNSYVGPIETWEWDGNDWKSVQTLHAPGTRSGAAASFSPTRKVVTLYGGYRQSTPLGDTWEYDGIDWTERIPLHAPGVNGGNGVMVYNPVIDQEVLFLNGTAQWDGTTWSLGAFSYAPTSQLDPLIMYFDPARQNVVMLSDGLWELSGGKWFQRSTGWPPVFSMMGIAFDDATGKLVVASEGPTATWEYDGASWSLTVPAPEPDFDTSAMVTAGNRALLLGTRHDSNPASVIQIFEWSSGAWSPVAAQNSPVTGFFDAVYDASRQVAVALTSTAYDFRDQLWEWDGYSWSQPTPQHTPLPLKGAAIAYDPIRKVTLLFGGAGYYATSNETWEWNGTDWTQRQPVVSPPPLIDAAMGYDEAHQCMVLFGGHDTSGSTQTWIFDGSQWARAWPSNSPASRDHASLVYDSKRGRLRLLGGKGLTRWDAWEWTGLDWLPLATVPDSAALYGEFHFAYSAQSDQFVGFGGDWADGDGVPDTWLYTPP